MLSPESETLENSFRLVTGHSRNVSWTVQKAFYSITAVELSEGFPDVCDTFKQWYLKTGSLKKAKPWFVAPAFCCCVNTSTMTIFKLRALDH